MPTYGDWNQGIIRYVTQGIPRGEYVFLSTDEDTIEAVGAQFDTEPATETWVADFLQAVRSRCVIDGKINLSTIKNPMRDSEGQPRYVGFLAAMVLAAYYMGEDEDKGIHGTDYFTHLNSVFDTDTKRAGLDAGEEDLLWQDWRIWLRSRGLLPSLQAGSGKYKYIGYPISQTLLRESDKDKLWRKFAEKDWSAHLDESMVMSRIRAERRYLNKHMQGLLDTNTPRGLQIFDSLSRACYEVYEDWVEADRPKFSKRTRTRRIRRAVRAAILRQTDFFLGTRAYYILPKQPTGTKLDDAKITYDGECYQLTEERPGWFSPLWEVTNSQLSNGLEVEIDSNHPTIQRLELAARDFWILTADPEIPESDMFASWQPKPQLGEPFILLCHHSLAPTVTRLKNEGLIEFEVQPQRVWDEWLEYQDVYVTSDPGAWSGVVVSHRSLVEALQPRSKLGISLRGGLRVPRTGGWIQGHGPTITVSAFHSGIHIRVSRAEDETSWYEADHEPAALIDIPWNEEGDHLLTVGDGTVEMERLIKIVGWDELSIAPAEEIPNELAHEIVFGALVKDT